MKTARRELKDNGRVSEELLNILIGVEETVEPSPQVDQVKEFLESTLIIQHMNKIRREIEERHRGKHLIDSQEEKSSKTREV